MVIPLQAHVRKAEPATPQRRNYCNTPASSLFLQWVLSGTFPQLHRCPNVEVMENSFKLCWLLVFPTEHGSNSQAELCLVSHPICIQCTLSPHWAGVRHVGARQWGDIFQTILDTFEPDKSFPESHLRQTKID